MSKKWRIVCGAVLAMLLFTGCSPFSFQNINELLRAPALGQGLGEVQKALKEYLAGEEPQYKFPKEGEGRSPFVLKDLDGNGQQEAVLFYSLPNSTSFDKGLDVWMAVLEQVDGKWTVVQDTKGLSTELAIVEVASMFEDNTYQLIVGYTTAGLAPKTLVLYQYEAGLLKAQDAGQYTNYLIGDFSGSGRTDIAIVSYVEEANKGGLKIDFLAGQIGEDGQKKFDRQQKNPVLIYTNFESCLGLYPSGGPEGEHLLVVDGTIQPAGLIASQVLNYSSSGEGFYALEGTADFINATTRFYSLLTARDIDNDGMIEIPKDTKDEIVTALGDKKLKFVEWMNYLGKEPLLKQFGLLDLDNNIYVRFPDSWQQDFLEGKLEVVDGGARMLWQVKNTRTGELLLELRHLKTGEASPGDTKQVPGSSSLFVFPKTGIVTSDKMQIVITSLV